jgi:DNA invertase Pin-like site-specific DNA recombinase
MFHIAGAFAELEREIIRERVRAGLRNAQRRGKRLGRPRAMVNIGTVTELAAKGLSGRAIARELRISQATVSRLTRGVIQKPAALVQNEPSVSAALRHVSE